MEKLQKTQVIVSSELSDEVIKLLSKQQQAKQSAPLSQLEESLNHLVASGDELKSQLGKELGESPGVRTFQEISGLLNEDQVKAYQTAVEANNRIKQKIGLFKNGQAGVEDLDYFNEDGLIASSNVASTQPISALFPGSKTAVEYSKEVFKSEQEKSLLSKYKSAQNKIRALSVKTNLQEDEMNALLLKEKI